MRCLSAGWRAARPPRRGATSAVFALFISFLLLGVAVVFISYFISYFDLHYFFLSLILVHFSLIPCFIVITL